MIIEGDVDRLVVSGSFQLREDYLPEDFDAFMLMLAQCRHRNGTTNIATVEAALPGLRPTVDQIFSLAGYVPQVSPRLKSTLNPDARPGFRWHVDYLDPRANSGARTGISIFFAESVGGDDRNDLLTAGRGVKKARDKLLSYKYREGPVVVAQSGFTAPWIDETVDLGATWHTGFRNHRTCKFVSIDFIDPATAENPGL